MKVLHVIPSVAARYGGPSRALTGMCRALRAGGAQVLVATTDADGPGRLPVELGRAVEHEGVPTIFFPRRLGEALKYSRGLSRWLGAHAREFDVVHVHAVFSHACLAAARACRRYGVPYVVRPLGTLDPWSLRQKPFRKQLYLRLGGRRMLERAAAVHYTTAEERRLAEASLGLGRGVVIPLGVGEEFLNPAAAQNGNGGSPYGKYVLQLSRLHPKKGLELLLDAFLSACARKGLKDWRLVLAGDGERPYVASLKRLVAEKRGEGRVVFAGWLGGDEKLRAVKHAALLTLPSYQENFGLCVIEALACGVPVLVSRHVNLAPEIESAGCGWVAPTERETLSRLLAAALSDEGERRRRGEAGRTLASRNYSWQAVGEKLVSLYAGLAGS